MSESLSKPFIAAVPVVIIIGILFLVLLLILTACIIGIIWRKKKNEEKTVNTQSSVLYSQASSGYRQVSQSSQPIDDYATLQRRMDKCFAQIKELEDRIDLETNEECRAYYNLQDGFDKASSRLDVIEYTINCKGERIWRLNETLLPASTSLNP